MYRLVMSAPLVCNPIELTVLDVPPIGELDFPYGIYCYDIDDLAQGMSPPRMRIRRPPI